MTEAWDRCRACGAEVARIYDDAERMAWRCEACGVKGRHWKTAVDKMRAAATDAMRAADSAWKRPWSVNADDLDGFIEYLEEAARKARALRLHVLGRMMLAQEETNGTVDGAANAAGDEQ